MLGELRLLRVTALDGNTCTSQLYVVEILGFCSCFVKNCCGNAGREPKLSTFNRNQNVFMSRLESAGRTRSQQELEGPPEPKWGMRENPERWECSGRRRERRREGMSQSSALLLLEEETASIENRQAEPSDALDQRSGPGGRYRADKDIQIGSILRFSRHSKLYWWC